MTVKQLKRKYPRNKTKWVGTRITPYGTTYPSNNFHDSDIILSVMVGKIHTDTIYVEFKGGVK